MGIPAWPAVGWLYSPALDRIAFHRFPAGPGALCLDVFSRLVGTHSYSRLWGEVGSTDSALVSLTYSLGGIVFYLCLASHLVRCFRDGNPVAWIGHLGSARVTDRWVAPLSHSGSADGTQPLGAP